MAAGIQPGHVCACVWFFLLFEVRGRVGLVALIIQDPQSTKCCTASAAGLSQRSSHTCVPTHPAAWSTARMHTCAHAHSHACVRLPANLLKCGACACHRL